MVARWSWWRIRALRAQARQVTLWVVSELPKFGEQTWLLEEMNSSEHKAPNENLEIESSDWKAQIEGFLIYLIVAPNASLPPSPCVAANSSGAIPVGEALIGSCVLTVLGSYSLTSLPLLELVLLSASWVDITINKVVNITRPFFNVCTRLWQADVFPWL